MWRGAIVLTGHTMLQRAIGGTNDKRSLAQLGLTRHPTHRHQRAQYKRSQQNMKSSDAKLTQHRLRVASQRYTSAIHHSVAENCALITHTASNALQLEDHVLLDAD